MMWQVCVGSWYEGGLGNLRGVIDRIATRVIEDGLFIPHIKYALYCSKTGEHYISDIGIDSLQKSLEQKIKDKAYYADDQDAYVKEQRLCAEAYKSGR